MNSSAFQAGLTLAPLLAGLPISSGHGLPAVGWVGAAIGVAALGLAFLGERMGRAPSARLSRARTADVYSQGHESVSSQP